MSGAVNYRAIYPDFEISLKRYGTSQASFQDLFNNSHSKKPYFKLLKKFERIYNKDKVKEALSSRLKIPKLIHQIWLGGNPPERYRQFMDSWKALASWKYRLWTDADLPEFDHPLLKQDLSLVEKADVLRLEILSKYGGLYVDTDVMCVNENFFDFANRQYSFYAGLEPLENYYLEASENFYLRCGTAIIAGKKGHPLISKCLEEIEHNYAIHPGKWPVTKTGPDFVTQMITSNSNLLRGGMIFPPTFFYPLSYKIEEAAVAKLHIRDETACVHYFDISWSPNNRSNLYCKRAGH